MTYRVRPPGGDRVGSQRWGQDLLGRPVSVVELKEWSESIANITSEGSVTLQSIDAFPRNLLGIPEILHRLIVSKFSDLLAFFLQRSFQQPDMLSQGLMQALACSDVALKFAYPRLHFRALDLPGVAVSLVSVPFRLKKAHNT